MGKNGGEILDLGPEFRMSLYYLLTPPYAKSPYCNLPEAGHVFTEHILLEIVCLEWIKLTKVSRHKFM